MTLAKPRCPAGGDDVVIVKGARVHARRKVGDLRLVDAHEVPILIDSRMSAPESVDPETSAASSTTPHGSSLHPSILSVSVFLPPEAIERRDVSETESQHHRAGGLWENLERNDGIIGIPRDKHVGAVGAHRH